MTRADVIFHGHFYQPPRENPWTDEVEREWSAEPFHDWNQRINHECYAANSASPVYDENGRVEQILDNYDRISFNVGPTLLSWMERHDRETLERILAADRRSRERAGGHGNAVAQAYNHIILPLADARDRRTQIRWGRREFEHRFGRAPEGMWLAETAANHEVLEELIAQDLRFVILAPAQAARMRPRDGRAWTSLSGDIDPSRSYFYRSRQKRDGELALFFYDGALAAECSFGPALSDGRILADAFEKAFDSARSHRQLLHAAVDGETAGHHVQWGNLALSWALAREMESRGFRITNYSQYLSENPPEFEVELSLGPLGEGSSWSCAHGVGRWIRDCGCRAAPQQATSQAWRTPLRQAMDLLRDRSRELFIERMAGCVREPFSARDDYIDLLLDESAEARAAFWARHAIDATKPPTAEVWTLLEMQHLTQLMYTSCGWFFDDIAGLEPVQILRYAARALELFGELGASAPRSEFLAILEKAHSNEKPSRTGREIFERDVETVRVTAERVAAHLAMAAVLGPPASVGTLGLYRYRREQFHVRQRAETQLVTAHFALEHRRTGAVHDLEVAMLHQGGLEFTAAVRPFDGEHFGAMQDALHAGFETGDDSVLGPKLDEHFSLPRYGAEDLLEPERQQILGRLFGSISDLFGEKNAQLYEEYRPLLTSLRELGWELPDELAATVGFALRRRLEAKLLVGLDELGPDPSRDGQVRELIAEVQAHRTRLVSPALSREFELRVEASIARAAEALPETGGEPDADAIDFVLRCLGWARDLGLELDLRRAQVLFYERLRPRLSSPWSARLLRLRERLHFSDQLGG